MHIPSHDLDNLRHDMHREEESLHDQTHGRPVGRLDHDLVSFQASWFVWGQPAKNQIDPHCKQDVAIFDANTHLQIPSTEQTLVEDECLSHKTWFGEFHIRIPAAYH